MPRKPIACPSCGALVSSGRLSCPACGTLVAAVTGVAKPTAPTAPTPAPMPAPEAAAGTSKSRSAPRRAAAQAAPAAPTPPAQTVVRGPSQATARTPWFTPDAHGHSGVGGRSGRRSPGVHPPADRDTAGHELAEQPARAVRPARPSRPAAGDPRCVPGPIGRAERAGLQRAAGSARRPDPGRPLRVARLRDQRDRRGLAGRLCPDPWSNRSGAEPQPGRQGGQGLGPGTDRAARLAGDRRIGDCGGQLPDAVVARRGDRRRRQWLLRPLGPGQSGLPATRRGRPCPARLQRRPQPDPELDPGRARATGGRWDPVRARLGIPDATVQ